MQLRPQKRKKIGNFLASSSLALLCATTSLAKDNESPASKKNIPPSPLTEYLSPTTSAHKSWAEWSGEVGLLGYSETKGRVQAIEPALLLNAKLSDDQAWSTKLVFDSLTGASPNGALNSEQPQTFTSPSGSETYIISPSQQPLYNQFRDTRINLSTSWTAPLSRLWKYNLGFNGSTEYDYLSLGLNASLTKESEDKNQSWSVGLAYTSDSINPVGGVPTPLAQMRSPSQGVLRSGGSESKVTYDLLMGLTQVINHRWIIQSNVSLGVSSGYMNDPYKFVTIFDDTNSATLGNPTSYIHEARPRDRFKRSLFVSSKNHFKTGILTVSYRYLNDDWGLSSHTGEASFNFSLSHSWRLEPSFRYYAQSAVDFYQLALGESQQIPQEITADYRLGDLNTIAPGLKIIRKLEDSKELSLILRYYQQNGDISSFTPVGSQIGQDLIPKTDAYIVQMHYSF